MARQFVRFRNSKHNIDYVLLAVVLFLIGFGLLMIYSTSSYEASADLGDAAYYLKKQTQSTLFGFVALIVAINFPYKKLQIADVFAILVSAILIVMVLSPLGVTRNGARRWLRLGFQFQPAEVAKIGVIIYVASAIQKLEAVGRNLIRTRQGLAIIMIPPAFIAALIYGITKNLSSAIIVMGIAVAVYFVAVPDYRWFIIAAVIVAALVAGVVMFAQNSDAASGFRLSRIRAWLDPESYSSDTAYQTLQALYAIGSGGIWGKGLGQSMQKRGFLPEAQNDMIFSIICEELGLFGAMIVILLFIVLIWSCMMIATKTTDRFGSLLVVGVMAHYAIQVILNIAVVTNSIPNTGITLPFISYGGTATVFLLTEIGIVLNVSKDCR